MLANILAATYEMLVFVVMFPPSITKQTMSAQVSKLKSDWHTTLDFAMPPTKSVTEAEYLLVMLSISSHSDVLHPAGGPPIYKISDQNLS